MSFNYGDMFQVREVVDLKDGDTVVARYRPGTGYRVTPLNAALVGELARRGAATPFEHAVGDRQASTPTVRGTARTL